MQLIGQRTLIYHRHQDDTLPPPLPALCWVRGALSGHRHENQDIAIGTWSSPRVLQLVFPESNTPPITHSASAGAPFRPRIHPGSSVSIYHGVTAYSCDCPTPGPTITTSPRGMAVVDQQRYFPVFQFSPASARPIWPHGAFPSSPELPGRVRTHSECWKRDKGFSPEEWRIHPRDLAVPKRKDLSSAPPGCIPNWGVNSRFLEREHQSTFGLGRVIRPCAERLGFPAV